MPPDSSADSPVDPGPTDSPDDGFLIASLAGGDAAALRKLMDRYDRLVRYAVFRTTKDRCLRDPQWLDSVASETWTGFVQSIRRDSDNLPKSLGAYLVQIARNRAVSAARRSARGGDPPAGTIGDDTANISAKMDNPAEELARIELIDTLRGCLAELDGENQRLASQLEAITERRWREAAQALGLKESTLRSRWKQVLAGLRRCLHRKTGKNFAPGPPPSDNLNDEGGGSAEEGL